MTTEAYDDVQVDAFGNHLSTGDDVIYIFKAANSNITICQATVVGRTAKMIRVTVSDSREGGKRSYESPEPRLTFPHVLVKCHHPTSLL